MALNVGPLPDAPLPPAPSIGGAGEPSVIGRYSAVQLALENAAADGAARRAARQHRRQRMRLIDAALERCERRNLGLGNMALAWRVPAPGMALAVIELVQQELGMEAEPPRSNQEAIEELFDLQSAYMPFADRDDEPVARRERRAAS